MKIIREIAVSKSATSNSIVDKYICSKCNCIIKEVEIEKRNNKKAIYSKFIYIDSCKNCQEEY
ncbi:MAG: hypothetical protein SPH93_02340 [Clostridium sp.]|uniref:hypothetical protein n=1 Tax=Clostridium sp. TaxID=1506 RepID=UPI002A9122A3|nr:hypothetical protein [Clostridium sp.]MDY6226511.1 hypothetical protein [Clostridium sp.]